MVNRPLIRPYFLIWGTVMLSCFGNCEEVAYIHWQVLDIPDLLEVSGVYRDC